MGGRDIEGKVSRMRTVHRATWAAAVFALAAMQPLFAAEKAGPADAAARDFGELRSAGSRPEPVEGSRAVAAVIAPLAKAEPADPAVWACAQELAALGKDALPELRNAAAGEHGAAAKLALGWSLLSLQDLEPGVKALGSVAGGRYSTEARVLAARLLGQQGRQAAEVEVTRLLDAADNGQVRVALAQALMASATTEAAQGKAMTALVRLAAGADPEVKAAAAIALGELDDFRDPVPAVLKGLAAEPTERGRLALKLLELKRLSDLMIREKEYAGSLGSPLLDEVKEKIRGYHVEPPPKEEALVDAAARGMASLLHKTDPFSSYLSAADWEEFREQISGTYGGIGAHVLFLKDDRTGEKVFTAVKPVYSGPAYKAGLRSYDQIIEIDGQDIKGKDADALRDMLRGLPESVVACKVRRRGLEKDEEMLLKIIRGTVTLPSVQYELMPGGIGYLRLDGFGDTSTEEVEKALAAMEKEGMKGLVFDLRNDPGGLLTAAKDIADKFLKGDKLIVYSEGRNKEIAPRTELRTTGRAPHPDYPIVVLVNGGTASAAEIVSGALQDHKRATLIGERTYGKGSVQQLMRLDSTGRRAVLKLTIAKYYLPSGRSIHRSADNRGGITPDIEVAFEQPWTPETFEKLLAAGDLHAYSLRQWPGHKKELMELADFDGQDASRYPGFDAWYGGLKVKTDRDSARRLLRQWVRMQTADERARDWPHDLEEDNQLQRAVYELGKKIPGLDVKAVPRYNSFVGEIEKGLKAAAGPK